MNTELYHYGIKGMKWGVRRYQNADGSLTASGRKKISKQYKKLSVKAGKEMNRSANDWNVKSYNKAADYMNGGGIAKFNEQQKKKYGEKFAQRDGYVSDYQKLFNRKFTENFNQTLNDFYSSNKNVQKGRDMVKKYDMTKWDDFARKNEAAIEDVRRSVEKHS